MPSIAGVVRLLLAVLVLLSAVPMSAGAQGPDPEARLSVFPIEQHEDECIGSLASRPCCQGVCLGCVPVPEGGYTLIGRNQEYSAPPEQIEPTSLARGGIERPPRSA
jgi:hypothetical protein